jgi:hypothetical protein
VIVDPHMKTADNARWEKQTGNWRGTKLIKPFHKRISQEQQKTKIYEVYFKLILTLTLKCGDYKEKQK